MKSMNAGRLVALGGLLAITVAAAGCWSGRGYSNDPYGGYGNYSSSSYPYNSNYSGYSEPYYGGYNQYPAPTYTYSQQPANVTVYRQQPANVTVYRQSPGGHDNDSHDRDKDRAKDAGHAKANDDHNRDSRDSRHDSATERTKSDWSNRD